MPDLVFMGASEFAIPPLKRIIKANYRVSLLICQPDKRKGRGKKIQYPPIKQVALDNSIKVFQPHSVRVSDAIEKIAAEKPEFIVVAAYGKILPKELLQVPKKGCVNIHASLLPAWRGAAPIQFSLLNGDEKTGVSSMLMDEGMDTGDLLLCRETEIKPNEMVDELSNRLSIMGAELILETLERFDQISPQPQNHEMATYSRLITKEDRIINWSQKAGAIQRQFRAFTPKPGMFTTFRSKRLKINEIQFNNNTDRINAAEPGAVVCVDKGGFVVACGGGSIKVLGCQPENRNRMTAKDFINGYQVKKGDILGG